MSKPKLRWGILGAAGIARKNWKAIWNSGNGRIVALASRDLEKGRRFIEECQAQAPFDLLPRTLASYDELISTPDIDAVYLPLPTALRTEWVKRAAEAGKHVVCEKPCAATLPELQEMLDTCRRHQVQFMDGVMFMHGRRLQSMRSLLDDSQTVGDIRRISSAFAWGQPQEFFATNIRARSELEPAGCLGDLGWYCIRFVLWAMKWKLPLQVTGKALSTYQHKNSSSPVPTEFSGELLFQDGVSASFYCSFLTVIEQWATVTGTRGFLHLPDFVLPFAGNETSFETGSPVFTVKGCDFAMEPGNKLWSVQEPSHSHPDAQESNLFRLFADQVQSGTLNLSWPEQALKTQQVMEACLESSRKKGQAVTLASLS